MAHYKIIPPEGAGGPQGTWGTKLILVQDDGTEVDLPLVRDIRVNFPLNGIISADIEIYGARIPEEFLAAIGKVDMWEPEPWSVDYKEPKKKQSFWQTIKNWSFRFNP